MPVLSYRDLDVWKKAMDLVVACYKASGKFPKHELFGLTSQLRRAAVSIAANIAEGQSRGHTKEFIQFLSVAYGSLAELETHVQIAERLGYLESKESTELLEFTSRVGMMLNGLKRSLKQ